MNHPVPTPPPLRLPPAPARSTTWIILLIASLVIGVIVVIGLVIGRFQSKQNAGIRELEAAVRAQGDPVTLPELALKYPPVPDAENVAVALIALWQEEEPELWAAYLAGARRLPEDRPKVYDPALPFLGAAAHDILRDVPVPAESMTAAEAFLREHQARFAQVQQALQRPRSRFPITLTNGFAALVPHLRFVRQEANYFRIAALVAAERNDSDAVLKALRSTTRLGELLADEPLLISQLVRLACLGLTLTEAEQWLSRQALDRSELEQLREAVAATDLSGAAHFALVSERPNALAAFDPRMAASLAAGDSEGETVEANERQIRRGFHFIQLTGYLRPDQRLMLQTFQQAIALAKLGTPDAIAAYDTLFAEVAVQAQQFPPKIFSAMLLPALQKVLPRFAAHEARRRAALAAIAVERYRHDHANRLPDQLSDLTPNYLAAVPTDPFDGASLRYRQLERGYVIYSMGADRTDHGGRERTKTSAKDSDVTFTVAR